MSDPELYPIVDINEHGGMTVEVNDREVYISSDQINYENHEVTGD